jgi:polyphosphate kinase 2 (PPK2 family)
MKAVAKDKSKDKQAHKKEKKIKEGASSIQEGIALSSNGVESKGASADQEPMGRKEFEKEIAKLQVELVKMQEWVKATGAKVCILFEGRDAAGKAGGKGFP